MTIDIALRAFVGGEVSDTIQGRVDQEIYFKSLLLARNVYVSPQGYLKRREGLRWLTFTPGNALGRLLSFSFGNPGAGVQAYLQEFTAQRMRVFRNDLQVADVGVGAYADMASLTYDVIKRMGYAQTADTLLLADYTMQTLRVTRTSDTAWTVGKVPFTNIPVFAYNDPVVTNPALNLTPSATSGEITLTLGGPLWNAGLHVKQYVVVNRGLVFITGVTSTTVATGLVISDLSSVTMATPGKWDLETGYEDVWSDARGWPSVAAFFKGRLYLAGGPRPQTTWASVVGDFYNMDQGDGRDSDGLEFTLDDEGVNAILNLYPGRTLQIFTTGGEFFVRSSSTKPLTPTNVVDLVDRAGGHGSEGVRPVLIDGATLWVELDGGVLRDFLYNDVEQSYTSNSRSDLADHLIRRPVDMAVRQARPGLPFDHVFVINEDGGCSVLNTKAQVEFDAWSSWVTEGKFLNVAVVNKEVYFIIERVIAGVTVRSIERLDAALKLDYSLSQFRASPEREWGGFNHQAGLTTRIRGDNFNLPAVTVSAGGVASVSEAVSVLESGLFFAASAIPLPPDVQLKSGQTLTARWRRMVWLKMLLKATEEGVIVRIGNKVFRPAFGVMGDAVLDQPAPVFSGWTRLFLDGVSQAPQFEITQDQPGDWQLLSIIMGVS